MGVFAPNNFRSSSRLSLSSTSRIIARLVDMPPESLTAHFVPAEEKHLPQIIAIRRHILPANAIGNDEAYLRWRYRFTPRKPKDDPWCDSRIWVLQKDERVLSFIGVEVVALRLQGRIVPCLKLMDLAALREFDGKGLGAWMNLVIQDSGMAIITLGSNANSVGMITKLFQRMPDRKVYKAILNSGHWFATRMGQRTHARAVALFYDACLYLWLQLRRLLPPTGVSLRPVEHFDARFEALLRHVNGNGTRLVRSADYLNWRLLEKPDDRAQIHGIQLGDEWIGFVAVTTREHPDGQREALLQDWAVLPGKRAISHLAAAFIILQQQLLRAGFNSISALGYDAASHAAFKRAHIHFREDGSKTFSVFCKDPETLTALSRAEDWFVTGSDADDF